MRLTFTECVAGFVSLSLVAAMSARAGEPPRAPGRGAVPPPPLAEFVGAAACASCHPSLHRKWSDGRHGRMLQPASSRSVLGDFSRGTLRLRGQDFRLSHQAGVYTITESYVGPQRRERRVDYTLGSRRIQHYLTTLEDGRIVVLPPTWDVQRREWFHNLEIVDPEEDDRRKVQVWNANCIGCHVSEHDKGFEAASRTYATTWVDFGTSCERCHGPGRVHAEAHRATPATARQTAPMVRPSHLGPERATAVCAQCHSLRDVSAPGFKAGADYFDYFLPVLEYGQKEGTDPAYWADGRPRRFSNDALGLWQSRCYLEGGATCITCHLDPHQPDIERNPQLAPADNRICLSCHEDIGARLPAHTRHRPDGRGSSCVECHMPPTVLSIKARMRDHAIAIPSPQSTVQFGIPNACNACHADKDAGWAARALQQWQPRRPDRLLARATAFAGSRRGEPAALPRLIALAGDGSEPPLVRANAIGHLRRFESGTSAALLAALSDAHPLPRAVAAFTLADRRRQAPRLEGALRGALSDPARVVRMAAAFALVNRGTSRLPGEAGRRLEEAKRDHLIRADLLPDHAPTQLDRGKLLFLDGDAAGAASSIAAALELEPGLSGGRYLLGVALAARGLNAQALAELRRVPASDPFYAPARELAQRLERR